MEPHLNFSIIDRIKSVRHALRGLGTMIKYEHNAWIHALATLTVTGFGFYFGFRAYEWCWVALAVVSVWTSEALNTAFEFLADVASPEFHPMVEKAKDVAAAAVLVTCLGAIVIGAMVMGPYILRLFLANR
jgi:diacylglycerol kinase (ATP)